VGVDEVPILAPSMSLDVETTKNESFRNEQRTTKNDTRADAKPPEHPNDARAAAKPPASYSTVGERQRS
jgi:hypothetical protein